MADGNVVCRKTECAELTACAKGQDAYVSTTDDGCCKVAFCRDMECVGETCDFNPPACQEYIEL